MDGDKYPLEFIFKGQDYYEANKIHIHDRINFMLNELNLTGVSFKCSHEDILFYVNSWGMVYLKREEDAKLVFSTFEYTEVNRELYCDVLNNDFNEKYAKLEKLNKNSKMFQSIKRNKIKKMFNEVHQCLKRLRLLHVYLEHYHYIDEYIEIITRYIHEFIGISKVEEIESSLFCDIVEQESGLNGLDFFIQNEQGSVELEMLKININKAKSKDFRFVFEDINRLSGYIL